MLTRIAIAEAHGQLVWTLLQNAYVVERMVILNDSALVVCQPLLSKTDEIALEGLQRKADLLVDESI